MAFLEKITDLASEKVKKFGAQYYNFGIFSIINYPVAYLYEVNSPTLKTNFIVRLIPTIFGFILLAKDYWPEQLKKYLPLFWHIVIVAAMPFGSGFLLLENSFSLEWLFNFTIGLTLLFFLVDCSTFVVLQSIGLLLAIGVFRINHNGLPVIPNPDQFYLFIYAALHTVLFGVIFARSRELYSDYLEKTKDDLNEVLEKKVQERTTQLELALQSRTDFLNTISHEIRTPVQGISGISAGLASNWDVLSDLERLKYAQEIAKNSDRLLSLVVSILDFSKYQNNEIKLDLREIALNNVIEDMVDECRTLYIKDGPLEITYQKEDDVSDSVVKADKEALAQVLRNIITNAIKFSPKNNPSSIRIEMKGGVRKLSNGLEVKSLECSIEDEGPGIPQNEIETIFEPFIQSTITKNKSGGVGLGLSIVRKLLEAHGGEIWAENKENNSGTIFKFWLPESLEKIMENYVDNNTKKDLNTKVRKVFMIDDEESCIMNMQLIILSSNFTFEHVSTGLDAIDYLKNLAEEEIPSVILLDLMLPDINGSELIQRIRSIGNLSSVPVILQSGALDGKVIDSALSNGADSYIRKPYSKDDILYEINKVINKNSRKTSTNNASTQDLSAVA